jgi:SAM-dependent methyltransferase
MDDRICYLCKGDASKPVRRIDDRVTILRCEKCGVARTCPYPAFHFESQEKYSRFYVENESLFRMFAKSMIDVIKDFKTRGSLLDIGCSVGYLLDEARTLGFGETRGVELNADAAAISGQKGHLIYTQPIEQLHLASGAFDVVACNHVVEHILDAKRFLREVRRMLKEDGVMYCGVPNYRSLMQAWLKAKWYGWGMPDHIWHFELSTFSDVMREAGFVAKRLMQNSLYYPYSKSLRKNTRATVARIADRMGMGDMVHGIFCPAPGLR